MSVEYVSNKEKKIDVRDEIFKCLNDDLINVFARKSKFDRYKSFETKVESFRIIYKVLFKTTQLSRDFDSFINHDFLTVRLKCLRNN